MPRLEGEKANASRWLLAVVVFLVVAFALWYLFAGRRSGDDEDAATPTPQPTEAAPTAAPTTVVTSVAVATAPPVGGNAGSPGGSGGSSVGATPVPSGTAAAGGRGVVAAGTPAVNTRGLVTNQTPAPAPANTPQLTARPAATGMAATGSVVTAATAQASGGRAVSGAIRSTLGPGGAAATPTAFAASPPAGTTYREGTGTGVAAYATPGAVVAGVTPPPAPR